MKIHPQLYEFCFQVGVSNVQAHCGLCLVLSEVPRSGHVVFEGLYIGAGQHGGCHCTLCTALQSNSSQQDGLWAPVLLWNYTPRSRVRCLQNEIHVYNFASERVR
jgi:hypothetical protein